MKSKISSVKKRILSLILTLTLLLSVCSVAVVPVSAAVKDDLAPTGAVSYASGTKFYFDASNVEDTSGYVYIIFNYSMTSGVCYIYPMAQISGTQLYQCTLTSYQNFVSKFFFVISDTELTEGFNGSLPYESAREDCKFATTSLDTVSGTKLAVSTDASGNASDVLTDFNVTISTQATEGGTASVSGYVLSENSSPSAVTATAVSAAESNTLSMGTVATLTATATTGYLFDGWYDAETDGNLISTDATCTVNVNGPKTYYANFIEKNSTTYKIIMKGSLYINDSKVTGVPSGATITCYTSIGAKNELYCENGSQKFIEWSVSGGTEGVDYDFANGTYSTDQTTYFRKLTTTSLTITPKFSSNAYTVTFQDWDGTVLKTQNVVSSTAAIPPADPTRDGYVFAGWDSDYSSITEDTVFTATYKLISVNLTVNSGSGGTVLSEGTTVAADNPTVIAAVPDYGYTFAGWTVNSGDTPADLTSSCTTVPITQDTVVTASFEKIPSVSDHSTLFDLATSSDPYVYVNKDVFALGEAVYAVADRGSWIGVYSLDVTAPTADDTLYYSYSLSGKEGKAVDIRSGEKRSPLIAGDYVAYLFEDEGYNAIAADTFTIYNPDNILGESLNRIFSSKTDYTYGEAVNLTAYATSLYLDNAWVGVYPAGADYTATSAKYMYFVKDHLGKTVNLIENSEINTGGKLSAGSYDIYLFGSEDFSTVLEKITINVSGGSISTNKNSYATFQSTSKTEDILTLAELYDADNTPINNYITPTVDNLRVYRNANGTDALETIRKGSPYRLIDAVSNGMAYIEYTAGKYGYCTFECITRYEYSDVVIEGYIKIETTLYADYERTTAIKQLPLNTPVSIIENDSSTVKIQVGGVIGYAEYYHISMTATPHTSPFSTVDSGSWVGIFPADTVMEASPTSTAWYYTREFWNKSVSITALAEGDGTNYRGTAYLPAGEYKAYLFGDSGYTNIIDSTAFTVTDGDYSGEFINGIYEVENLTDGFANGTVTLEADPDCYGFLSISDAVLYWADTQGNHLADYNCLARQHIDTPVFSFDMYSHTIIPEGAACLMAYMSCGTVNSTASFRLNLPDGCATYNGLDDGILSEFQMVSDLHITSDQVTAYPNGQGLINEWYHVNSNWFYQLLIYDVTAHSPNSAGIFVNGDVANNGLAEEYAEIAELTAPIAAEGRPYPIPQMYVNMGNHDSYPGGIEDYVAYANSLGANITEDKPYYSKMVNGYKYIFLAGDDSSYYGLHDVADHDSAVISDAQLQWLNEELLDNEQNNAGKPVFVMLHQSVPDSVAGSFEGQWGYNWGIKNHEELTDILTDYNNVILLSGHSHWELDAPGNLNAGSSDISVAVNTASIGYLWTDYSGAESYMSGSQGFYVRVYEDKVVFLGRDFYNHKWLPSACYVIYNEDVSAKYDKKVLPLGEKLNSSEYITNSKGRTLTFESSDSSIVTVDENGKITAVGKGNAVVYITAVATNTEVVTREKIEIVVPLTTTTTISYIYEDRSGNEQTYKVVHNLSDDEILGFEGNSFTPYAPAHISGEGWVNAVLVNAPYIIAITDDIAWAINSDTYNTDTFTLKATQTDRLFTITSQVGEGVEINQKTYGELLAIDARHLNEDVSATGFWYNDTDDDGKYTHGTDLMLTYGPRFAYRITCDMNINYEETDKYDFNITIDFPAYGRSLTTGTDGTVTDKVTVDYMINILTPYFYGNNSIFVPSDDVTDDPAGQHVTVESLRNAGYTVNFGVILEQVGSFAPGSTAYPTFEDALTAAKGVNYGTATSSQVLTDEVIDGYTAPVKTSVGTYCTVYDCSDYNITNKNRFGFTIGFKNTAANHKKFFNVYSYVTITTPDKVTTTYISNVQTLNIYTTGTASN